MFDFFLLKLAEWGITEHNSSLIALLIAVSAIAVSFVIGIFQIWTSFWLDWKTQKTKRELDMLFGVESFDEDQIRSAIATYIEPDCSQTDPTSEEDLRQVVSVREPIFTAVDRFLSVKSSEKHLLLLADSGMGKTSFLLNYFERNRQKKASAQDKIAVLPLGRPDVLDNIRKIENKRATILCLDAFDEDTEAIRDHQQRLQALMEAAADFRRIILTSRTQFFASDEEIPKRPGVAIVGPRKAGEPGEYSFYKIYLLPLTDDQVRDYVRLIFPWWHFKKRRSALRLVKRVPELSIRPMLLAVIPDLVRKKQLLQEIYELYGFMVESWLQRESRWIDPVRLLSLSEIIAVDIFIKRGIRKAERLSRLELLNLTKISVDDLDAWHLTNRSLLNRDAQGNYKYAHRSIMEYLFVSAYIKGERLCLSVEWTDLMKELFVSVGRVLARENRKKENEVLLERLRNDDFSRTLLFPIAKPSRPPGMVADSDVIESPRKGRLRSLYARLPVGWSESLLRFGQHEESSLIKDLASGRVWLVPNPFSEENPLDTDRLFIASIEDVEMWAQSLSEGANFIEGPFETQRRWRLPTIEEFDLLVISSRARQVLSPSDLYWIGDKIKGGHHLVVGFSQEEWQDNRQLRYIGPRVLDTGSNVELSYHIFEVIPPPRPVSRDKAFVARYLFIADTEP